MNEKDKEHFTNVNSVSLTKYETKKDKPIYFVKINGSPVFVDESERKCSNMYDDIVNSLKISERTKVKETTIKQINF